jgi:hypothetical protein
MRINRHTFGRRYYECENHAVFKTCANRSRYRVDMIEDALLHKFGLGWLRVASAPKTVADTKSLEAEVTKQRDREKRLAAKLQELDDDDMYNTVMTQLKELRGRSMTRPQS